MATELLTHIDDCPTDNFKISATGVLRRPIGNFVENAMRVINEENDRLGLDPLIWYVYDRYDGELHGAGWEYDSDSDCQRKAITPSAGHPTQLAGYWANVRNYITDLAVNVQPVLQRYGFDYYAHPQYYMGLCAQMPPLAELDYFYWPGEPNSEDYLNTCRLKLCAALLRTDRIDIYNVLQPLINSAALAEKNRVCSFYLRDENGDKLSGATAFHVVGMEDAQGYSYNYIYLLVAFGSTLRCYYYNGAPMKLPGTDAWYLSLNAAVKSLSGSYYIDSGGAIHQYSFYSGDMTDNACPMYKPDATEREATEFTEITNMWVGYGYYHVYSAKAFAESEFSEISGFDAVIGNYFISGADIYEAELTNVSYPLPQPSLRVISKWTLPETPTNGCQTIGPAALPGLYANATLILTTASKIKYSAPPAVISPSAGQGIIHNVTLGTYTLGGSQMFNGDYILYPGIVRYTNRKYVLRFDLSALFDGESFYGYENLAIRANVYWRKPNYTYLIYGPGDPPLENALTGKVSIYTGDWPVVANASNFNAVGTALMEYSIENGWYNDATTSGSYDFSPYEAVDLSLSDLRPDHSICFISEVTTQMARGIQYMGDGGPRGACSGGVFAITVAGEFAP